MGNVPLNQTGLGARALFDGASPSKARAQFTRNSNYGVHRRRLDSSSSVTFLPLSLAPPVSFFDPLYFPSHAPMLIPACVCVGMCCSQASMHSCSRGTKVSRQWLEIQDGIKMVSHLMVHFRILCGWGGAILCSRNLRIFYALGLLEKLKLYATRLQTHTIYFHKYYICF